MVRKPIASKSQKSIEECCTEHCSASRENKRESEGAGQCKTGTECGKLDTMEKRNRRHREMEILPGEAEKSMELIVK